MRVHVLIQTRFVFTDGSERLTQVLLSEPGEVDGGTVRYAISLQA